MNLDFLNVLGDADDLYESASERSALKDNRTDIKFDPGDQLRYIGAMLLGRGDEFSKEALLQGASDAENKRLNKDATRRKAIRTIQEGDGLLGNDRTPGEFKIVSGTDVDALDDKLASASNLATRAIEAKARDPELNLAGVGTIGGITQRMGDRARERKNEVGGANYLEQIRQDEQKYRRQQDANARLDRLSREKSELAIRRDEMDYRYAAMARQDRLDAQNRRDKAIMALMQGLGNLGAAFTI